MVLSLSNMFCEDSDPLGLSHASLVEDIGGNTLDRIAKTLELALPLVSSNALLVRKVVQRGTAYLTVDYSRLVHHRKFIAHPIGVVTDNPAPLKRHLLLLDEVNFQGPTVAIPTLSPRDEIVERCDPLFNIVADAAFDG